jgi:hypothetical protein
MFEAIIRPIAEWIINVISSRGYTGIVVTIGIESACIPLPSEIIMPFSENLVSTGRFTMLWVSVAGVKFPRFSGHGERIVFGTLPPVSNNWLFGY